MKKFEILYARNSNGKINQWAIGVQDDGKAVIWEGILGSENQTRTERQSKGKNIGKMNETTAYEQACKDAESRWNLKKKKGYKSCEDLGIDIKFRQDKFEYENEQFNIEMLEDCIDNILPKNRTDANSLSKPMLALPMFDPKTGKTRASFPMIGQPKLNGFRMMCRWETVEEGEGMFKTTVEKPVFRSRDGIRFDTLQHIEPSFIKKMFFTEDGKEIAYDGELYRHEWLLQRINSAVNKKNSDTEDLVFVVFDLAVENINYSERRKILVDSMIEYFPEDKEINVGIINCELVKTLEEAEKFTDQWIKNGYEGGIFRDPKAFYQFGKRGKSMLKLKRFQDKEFLILDVIGGDNSPELGVFVCQAENGKTFKCTPQGTHEVKAEYLTNKENYKGRRLQVKFYERTKDGLPFHSVGLVVRDVM